MEIDDLTNRFSYHSPDQAKTNTHELVRSLVTNLAEQLNVVLTEGREKAVVFTKLEEVMFWSNASVARSK